MYRLCLLLILCGFGALSYRIDYDLEDLKDWQYDLSEKECIKDIIVVLDTSSSIGIGPFKKVKTFLKDLVTSAELNVNKDNTRVGLVVFGEYKEGNPRPRYIKTKKMLGIGDISDATELGRYMDNINYGELEGKFTRTDIGLEIAKEMFEKYRDDHPDRDDVQDVAIILTDGQPRAYKYRVNAKVAVLAQNAAEALKHQGVQMIGYGMGTKLEESNKDRGVLIDFIEKIVTDSSRDAFFQEKYDDIDKFLNNIIGETCRPSVPCHCGYEIENPFDIKAGESTVLIDIGVLPEPDISHCVGADQVVTRRSEPSLPYRFGVGEQTLNYIFTVKGRREPIKCPVKIIVNKAPCPPAYYGDECKDHCSCTDTSRTVLQLGLGETTAVLGEVPPVSLDCTPGFHVRPMKIETQPPLPKDNRFGLGKHEYTRTVTKDGDFIATCPLTIEVNIGKWCAGKRYDGRTEVCCCGSIHTERTGNKCCGKSYYNPNFDQCCADGNLIPSHKTCPERVVPVA